MSYPIILIALSVLPSGLVSVVFLWITMASIIWPEQIVKELFVIPITALFAFTSVRANLPGAPAGFGEFYPAIPSFVSFA